jgi:hypothetical protein
MVRVRKLVTVVFSSGNDVIQANPRLSGEAGRRMRRAPKPRR